MGNRFHVMFQLAGVLYHLREKLGKNNTITLRTLLLRDLRNINILLQLCALGIIGKVVMDHGCMNYIETQVF